MQLDQLKRRQFVTLLGGAAAWPLAARARQPERMRRIGVLMGTEDDAEGQARLTAFRRGLLKLGWEEQKNVQIHARFGGSNPQRYQHDAIELVGLNPDVILGSNTPIIQALKRATQTIPIVFVSLSDPVQAACEKDATDKKLRGAAKASHMKKCVADAAKTAPVEKCVLDTMGM